MSDEKKEFFFCPCRCTARKKELFFPPCRCMAKKKSSFFCLVDVQPKKKSSFFPDENGLQKKSTLRKAKKTIF
jgi:hypothetical protein